VTNQHVPVGISTSEVSRICADLDVDVSVFQGRDLTEQAFPYVFVDATPARPVSVGKWSSRL
jgi:transposase-like protein